MKKRYWLGGAVILYGIVKLSGSPDGEPASRSPGSDIRHNRQQPAKAPETFSTNTAELPSTEVQEKMASPVPANYPTKFVHGNGVAFRAGPATTHPIIDRFDKGRKVLLLAADADWSKVRDALTQREGWMASRFLSDQKPETKEKQASQPQKDKKPEVAKPPALPESVIVQRIIAESIAGYPGSCPCPYNVDRGGRRCGKRSAYSKPGGYAPLCFAGDVTRAMIDAFRSR